MMRVLIIGLLVILIPGCGTKKSINPYLISGDGYADVRGGKVWYGIMGEGNKPPFVCLHGGPGGTSRSYFHLSEVANDRPVILIDQLGGGQSTHHMDTSLLTVESFVGQVKAVVDVLGLKEFYLTGHSWGTALALEYYSVHPTGVKGIVFNSPYFSTDLWITGTNALVAAMPDSIQHAIRIADQDSVYDSESYKNANDYFVSQHILRTERKEHPFDSVKAPGNSFIYHYMWGPSEFRATGTLRDYDNLKALENIKVPVLFTTGEFDESRPVDVKKFVDLVEDAKFVEIPGAGHASLSDNLSAYVKAHRDFANNVDELKP
jgi:proline iminopeptidase